MNIETGLVIAGSICFGIFLEKLAKRIEANKYKWKPLSHRTICETIREIHNSTTDENIRALCVEATGYAKKMNNKLIEYRDKYGAKDYRFPLFDKPSKEKTEPTVLVKEV